MDNLTMSKRRVVKFQHRVAIEAGLIENRTVSYLGQVGKADISSEQFARNRHRRAFAFAVRSQEW